MLYDLFSTPLYTEKVSNYDEIQHGFDVVSNDTEWQDLWQSHKITDNTFKKNLIHEYNLDTFSRELDYHVREYTSWDRDFNIQQSWMTKMEKGDYAICPAHAWSDLSGVYWYKTNGEDGSIYFQTPNLAQATSIWDARPNHMNFQPEQGRIMLFPGWLRHGVESNTSDNTRMSVSFNITFERL